MAKTKPSAKNVSGIPAKFIGPAQETLLSEFHPGVATEVSAGAAVVQGMVALLQQLGYETVEEAYGVLRVAGRELARQFGVDMTAVQHFAMELAVPGPRPRQ